MNSLLKSKLLKFINFIATVNLVVYLVACLTPYIHPIHFSFLTFLAIGFPILIVSICFWMVIYLFINAKKSVLFFVIMLAGFKNITNTFGLNVSAKNDNVKPVNAIRIISWNVRGFVAVVNNKNIYGGSFKGFINYIKKTNADVVCLQDFDQDSLPNNTNSLQYIKDSLGYKNVYFSVDFNMPNKNGFYKYGTCIFSKFPIVQSNSIRYNDGIHFNESLGFADIIVNKKSIRIFTTHLKSMYTNILPTAKTTDFKYQIDDTNLVLHSTKLEKLQRFDISHIKQANIIKNVMDTTKIPFVFCADLNAVPTSFVYSLISHNLNDAFLQNNFGWGSTYSSKIPFLRIDVILMSKQLKAINYKSPQLILSDHYPVIADIVLVE